MKSEELLNKLKETLGQVTLIDLAKIVAEIKPEYVAKYTGGVILAQHCTISPGGNCSMFLPDPNSDYENLKNKSVVFRLDCSTPEKFRSGKADIIKMLEAVEQQLAILESKFEEKH